MNKSLLDRATQLEAKAKLIDSLSVDEACDISMELQEVIACITLFKMNLEDIQNNVQNKLKEILDPNIVQQNFRNSLIKKSSAFVPEVTAIDHWQEIPSTPLFWHKTEQQYGIKIGSVLIKGNLIPKQEFDVRNWIPSNSYSRKHRTMGYRENIILDILKIRRKSKKDQQIEKDLLSKTTMHDILLNLYLANAFKLV